jgi:hypothetical protein
LLKSDLSMEAAFSPLFITLYIYKIPLPIATRIFEAFIVDGEVALLKILFKMLSHKRAKIMTMGEELIEYLRKNIIVECIEELSIDNLINY